MEQTRTDRRYDVIVAGGGLTGVAAAVSAARLGKTVLLIEESGCLGGAASQALVFPFMPYWTKTTDGAGNTEKFVLSRGFLEEIVRDLEAGGNILRGTAFDTEALKLLLDRKVTGAGAEVLFHATLCGVEKKENTVVSVSAVTAAGILTFAGSRFIDCTGDADLTVLAGVPTHLGREPDHLCQPMTLCFRVGNVDKKRFFEAKPLWKGELYDKWKAAGKTSNPRENVLVFDYPAEGVLHFNTTRVVKLDPTDPFDLTRAEMEARKQAAELMSFFRECEIPGTEKAELLYTAPSIGVRESRMLDGEYTLTGKDLRACTRFDDAVAAGNYDIDIHNPEGSGTSHYYFPNGTWYTVPYRALIPKISDCRNLIVAGRCISVDHEAQASIRIMPICTTLGEAAGVAASVSLDENVPVQRASVGRIRKILAESGAFTGF